MAKYEDDEEREVEKFYKKKRYWLFLHIDSGVLLTIAFLVCAIRFNENMTLSIVFFILFIGCLIVTLIAGVRIFKFFRATKRIADKKKRYEYEDEDDSEEY